MSTRPPINYLTFAEFNSLPESVKGKVSKQLPDAVRVKYGLVAKEPRPCPFCGRAPKFKRIPDTDEEQGYFWALGCYHRECHVAPGATGLAKATALVSWNSRAKEDAS